MSLSTILQRTIAMLSPWTQHTLQRQQARRAQHNGIGVQRPTTIQMTPVADGVHFVAQSQRVARFADHIVTRQQPKTLVQTVQRTQPATPAPMPMSLPLPGSRQLAALAHSLTPAETVDNLANQPQLAELPDSWIMRQPGPIHEGGGMTNSAAASNSPFTEQGETATRAGLVTQMAQRPHLASVAEQIEERIQRAAALRRGETVAPPVINPVTETTLPAQPMSIAAEIQRRIAAAQLPGTATTPDFTAAGPVEHTETRASPEQLGLVTATTDQHDEASTSSVEQPAAPRAGGTTASAVAEIQRRIAQAAQSRLAQSTSVQPAAQVQPSPAPRSPAAAAAGTKLPPQVRRMRAISQIEEIGSSGHRVDRDLPVAVPATAADFAKAHASEEAPLTDVPHLLSQASTTPVKLGQAEAQPADPSAPSALPPAPVAPSPEVTQPASPAVQRRVVDSAPESADLPIPSNAAEDVIPDRAQPDEPPVSTTPLAESQTEPVLAVRRTPADSSRSTPPTTQAQPARPQKRSTVNLPPPADGQQAADDSAPTQPLETTPSTEQTLLQRSVVAPVPGVQPPASADLLTVSVVEDPPGGDDSHPPADVAAAPAPVAESEQPPPPRQALAEPAPPLPLRAEGPEPDVAPSRANRSPAVPQPPPPVTAAPASGVLRAKPVAREAPPVNQRSAARAVPTTPDTAAAAARPPALDSARPSSDSQAALAMPLATPVIQRQAHRLTPMQAPGARRVDASAVQPQRITSAEPAANRPQTAPIHPVTEPTPQLAPLVSTMPSIERRIDLNTLRPASPSLVQRQSADMPQAAPQLLDVAVKEHPAQEAGSLDLDALAQEILPLVKRLLTIEREREPYFG